MNARLRMKRIAQQLKEEIHEKRKAREERMEWIAIVLCGIFGSALVWWVKYLGG